MGVRLERVVVGNFDERCGELLDVMFEKEGGDWLVERLYKYGKCWLGGWVRVYSLQEF